MGGESEIVVTGGTGFLGRQIVRSLVDRGCDVRVLTRNPRTVPPGARSSYTPDLFRESVDQLEVLLRGARTLVHAAWYTEPGKYLTSDQNFDCLAGTLRLASAFGGRFVGVGTCAEYDTSEGKLSTDTPLSPQTTYAFCKAAAFNLVGSLVDDFAWCRVFYLYGEGEDSRRLVPYIRSRLEAGEPAELTSGQQIRDFLDVQEAGEMIADVALCQQQGPVNICSEDPISVRQLAEQVADEYGRRDLLRFGARADNTFDPPLVVGVR